MVLLDQAGWHQSERLVIPENITLMSLPAKAPGLNSVVNVWQFMRENWFSNRIFTSYGDILDHCCEAWNRLTRPALAHHVHRTARLGSWVLINESQC